MSPSCSCTVSDHTNPPLLSLHPSPPTSPLSLSLPRPPCSLSQKPQMLTGDILRLWGQGCRGKHFPPSNSPLTSDQLEKIETHVTIKMLLGSLNFRWNEEFHASSMFSNHCLCLSDPSFVASQTCQIQDISFKRKSKKWAYFKQRLSRVSETLQLNVVFSDEL